MTYFIFDRDGTSRIVLKRDTREAAEKKARELKDLGWFNVQIEEADSSKAAFEHVLAYPPASAKARPWNSFPIRR